MNNDSLIVTGIRIQCIAHHKRRRVRRKFVMDDRPGAATDAFGAAKGPAIAAAQIPAKTE
jgi:hypothetical protein